MHIYIYIYIYIYRFEYIHNHTHTYKYIHAYTYALPHIPLVMHRVGGTGKAVDRRAYVARRCQFATPCRVGLHLIPAPAKFMRVFVCVSV